MLAYRMLHATHCERNVLHQHSLRTINPNTVQVLRMHNQRCQLHAVHVTIYAVKFGGRLLVLAHHAVTCIAQALAASTRTNTTITMHALQVLETCVKSCIPLFFEQLIQSELWAEMLRAGDPTRRVSTSAMLLPSAKHDLAGRMLVMF